MTDRQKYLCARSPSMVFLKLSEEVEKNGGVSKVLTCRQSATSWGSGRRWTIGLFTFPAGFLLMGEDSVPGGREGGKGKQPGYYRIFKKNSKTKNTPQITATSPVSSLTVADGSQRVVVLHALTDDSPLGKDGVRTQRVHVKIAPGSHQVICADVTCVSPDSKVPVGQGEGRVLQHVLGIEYE